MRGVPDGRGTRAVGRMLAVGRYVLVIPVGDKVSRRKGVAGEDPVRGINRVAGRMSSAHLVPPPLLLE